MWPSEQLSIRLIQILIRLVLQCLFGSKQKRYEARHQLLDSLTYRLGYRLYNKNLVWHSEQEYLQLWAPFAKRAGYKASYIHERRYNFLYIAKSTAEIEGATAECGVFRGAGSYLTLASAKEKKKKHYVFDSFEGLSMPGTKDQVESDTSFKWKQHDLSVAESLVRKNLAHFDNVEYCKGWIPDKFHVAEGERFSFVHIDVDLFDPTLDSLEFFYPRMNAGGIILCDDYGFSTCPGAKKAFDQFVSDKKESIIALTTGQGFIVKQ